MLGLESGGEDELARDKDTSGQSNSPSGENSRQESQTSTVSTGLEEEAATTASVVASNTPTQSGGGFPSISSQASTSPGGQFGIDAFPLGSIADLPGYNPEYLSNFLTDWKAFPLDEFEFEFLSELTQSQPSNSIQHPSQANHAPHTSDKTATPSATCGCRSPASWVALCCPHGKDPKVLFPIFEANALSTPPYETIELLVEYYFKYFHLCSFPVMSEWDVYQLMHPKNMSEDQPTRLMSLALLNALMFTASAVRIYRPQIL